jgi:hypothetical protein
MNHDLSGAIITIHEPATAKHAADGFVNENGEFEAELFNISVNDDGTVWAQVSPFDDSREAGLTLKRSGSSWVLVDGREITLS